MVWASCLLDSQPMLQPMDEATQDSPHTTSQVGRGRCDLHLGPLTLRMLCCGLFAFVHDIAPFQLKKKSSHVYICKCFPY